MPCRFPGLRPLLARTRWLIAATELAESLTEGGWAANTSQDGQVQIFQKDGAKYVLRERAGSHRGWTADFTPSGASDVTLKIRLGYRP